MSYATTYELPEDITAATHAIAVTVIDGYANEFAPRFLGEELKADVTPQLLSPLNEANIILPTWLTWQPISDAMGYTVEIAYDNDFESILATVQTDSAAFLTQQIAKIDGSHKTYWRVKANVANAKSNWSETRWFEGSVFSVNYPADGQGGVSVTPTIEWDNAGADATYYCEVATANTFYSGEIVFSHTTKETKVTIPADVLSYSKNYYVRVKVSSPVVNSISATTLFTTEDIVMQVPVIISPADGAEVVGPTLKVTVKDTPNNGFRFELSKVASFPGRATKVKVAELGSYSVEYDGIEDGEYFIRVATLETPTEYTDFSAPVKVKYTYNKVAVAVDNAVSRNAYIINNILYAPADTHYTIYTLTGAAIATGTTTETTHLPHLSSGAYIITLDGVALKYIVK
jgi:hypothetical protein